MPCFSPLEAWQTASGKIQFKIQGDIYRTLKLPCGQCIGCRLERSRQWAMRCVHENQMHDFSCFVTLTYDDSHLPVDNSLRYRDFQLFMKKLRDQLPRLRQRRLVKGADTLRFYMCGEYGESFGRPHYHALLFGAIFTDLVPWKQTESGAQLYVSPTLDKIWENGFTSVGEVNFESAAYVARYVMKKVTGDKADEHYKCVSPDGEVYWRVPEFTRMSLRPHGIGAAWFQKFRGEVVARDGVVMRGMLMKPPRYYDKRLAELMPEEMDWKKVERETAALARAWDNTPERLAVREKCVTAGLQFKKRKLV